MSSLTELVEKRLSPFSQIGIVEIKHGGEHGRCVRDEVIALEVALLPLLMLDDKPGGSPSPRADSFPSVWRAPTAADADVRPGPD